MKYTEVARLDIPEYGMFKGYISDLQIIQFKTYFVCSAGLIMYPRALPFMGALYSAH